VPDGRLPIPPFPTPLVGERVVVRCYTVEDARALKEAVDETRDALLRWMPWGDDHRTLEQSLAFCGRAYARFHERSDLTVAIFERESGRFLGGSGLHVQDPDAGAYEIGWWIRASAEGRGYVSETARLVTATAFEALLAERVMVRCDVENVRSLRVIERLGFPNEGTMRRTARRRDGSLRDTRVHAMVREDYAQAKERWAREARRRGGA
jgi:RimJ/RimL family protein N-acetyltransferase